MVIKCPGCASRLNLGTELFAHKVVVRCPECLQMFVARSEELTDEADATGDATLLVSDKPGPKGGQQKDAWKNEAPSLSVIRGPDQGIHLRIKKDEMVVGREDADLILTDPAISKWHCRIFREKQRYYLEDLGSRNGTHVNKKKIQRAELSHLDEVELGQTLIIFSEYAGKEDLVPQDVGQELDQLRDSTKAGVQQQEAKMPSGREFILEVLSAKNKARSYKIDRSPLILGRGEEAHLRLDDDEVSRKHASIEVLARDNAFITDLASQNGTYLNGAHIRSMRLKHGDKIRIGQTILQFVIRDTP
jgi:pSer/pThr/pTyr-binding forkhead associated (FHA) protein